MYSIYDRTPDSRATCWCVRLPAHANSIANGRPEQLHFCILFTFILFSFFLLSSYASLPFSLFSLLPSPLVSQCTAYKDINLTRAQLAGMSAYMSVYELLLTIDRNNFNSASSRPPSPPPSLLLSLFPSCFFFKNFTDKRIREDLCVGCGEIARGLETNRESVLFEQRK